MRDTDDDGESSLRSRRRFLATTAASASGLVGSGVAVGAAREDGRAARATGIEGAVERSLRRDGGRAASKLLRRHGVKHDITTTGMPTIDDGSGDGGGNGDDVTTRSVYDVEDSRFTLMCYRLEGDVYRAVCTWTLAYSFSATIDGAGPDDGVGITVNEANWEPVIGSWAFGAQTDLDARGDQGVIGSFEDPNPYCDAVGCYWPRPEQREGWMRVDLEKQRAGQHNVYGSYVHTWNPFSVPGFVKFGLNAGPITVDAEGQVHHWTARSDLNL